MCCLVTAGKQVNDIRALARQPPITTEGLLEAVFSVGSASSVYSEDPRPAEGKACGIDGIPNECLRHLPRRPLVHITHLFNHCFRLCHFPTSRKEAKIITAEARQEPKISTKFTTD
jgi:hypothetical protein